MDSHLINGHGERIETGDCGAVEKVYVVTFEIATRFSESIAMTRKSFTLSLRGVERRSNLRFFNSPTDPNKFKLTTIELLDCF